jgi:hypothetical protein
LEFKENAVKVRSQKSKTPTNPELLHPTNQKQIVAKAKTGVQSGH